MTGDRGFHPVSTLLAAAGLLLLVAAAGYNVVIVERLDPSPPLAPATAAAIRQAQLVWATAGLLSVGLAVLLRRIPALRRGTTREGAALATLVVLSLAVPVGLLEFALRPWFVPPRTTTLFERDAALGWRHRRGVHTVWEGVPVQINSHGLRGPEVPHAKPAGVVRILWLGDSVTFGDKMSDDADTFPFAATVMLTPIDAVRVEPINAGVSGYSTWQELQYFREEGLRYDPDLVVVDFVPNDVTEFLELTRFGGAWEGWQLWYTRSRLQQALGHSALVQFLTKGLAQVRFGGDVPGAARGEEVISGQALVDAPDRPDVQAAWERALEDLAEIVALARAKSIPVVLVVFPFAFQMERIDGTPPPQQTLRTFAAAHAVPFLDLLPRLQACAAAEGGTTDDYFLDHIHLTRHGHRVVAAAVAEFIATSGSLPVAAGLQPQGCGG